MILIEFYRGAHLIAYIECETLDCVEVWEILPYYLDETTWKIRVI